MVLLTSLWPSAWLRTLQARGGTVARDFGDLDGVMKGILIATAMATVYFIAVTIAFRTLDVRRRAAFMVGVWLVTLPAFVMLHQLTPADLGVLPVSLTEP